MLLSIKSPTRMIFVILILAATILSGCAGLNPKPAAFSNDEVVAQADQLLNAIFENDRTAFVTNFDTTMTELFTESEFSKFREMLIETSGDYQSCDDPQLLNQEDFAVYRLACKFEKEEVTLTLVYPIDGNQITGLFVDSGNIRSYSEN